MRIAFTAKGNDWNSLIDERFGRSEKFVIFDEENNSLEVIENNTEHMEHGAGLQAVKKIIDNRVDIVITGNGAGQKVLDILDKSEVKFYIGANGLTLKEAYEKFKNGELTLQ